MSYIVIFNVGYRDPQILTNDNGFVEEFYTEENAKEEAEKWLDSDDFRSYVIYESDKR